MAVFRHTLFIAAIALLAPFIPADIEVPAYIALTNRWFTHSSKCILSMRKICSCINQTES